jgi:hypothetical protein
MARDDPFPSRFAFRTSHDFHPLIRCLTCLCDTAKFYPQYVLGSAKVMTEGVLICGEMPDLITVETDILVKVNVSGLHSYILDLEGAPSSQIS